MREIVAALFQTLDGVIQAPGGPDEDPTGDFEHGGWQFAFPDDVADAAIGKLCEPPFAMLLGRRTYDIFASYWPYVEGEAAELGAVFTKADKYVLTRGDGSLDWENSHRVADLDAVAELRSGDGPELRIWGSSTLHSALLAAGLLDKLTLLTYPLVLGQGKRAFSGGKAPGALRLTEHALGPSGVVIATYEPAGAIGASQLTGASSPPAPPNARESKRQHRIADGTW